jgi:hypothetical protein
MRDRVADLLRCSAPALLVNDDGRRQLGLRVAELVGEAGETLDAALARCRHVLARAEFEAVKARNMEWLDGQMWRKDRFERLASRPLEGQRSIQVCDLSASSNPYLSGGFEPSISDEMLARLDEHLRQQE